MKSFIAVDMGFLGGTEAMPVMTQDCDRRSRASFKASVEADWR